MQEGRKVVAQNKKAFHDYFVEDTVECGLVLYGTEVKSIRNGGVNLRESYAAVQNGELFLYNMHVSPYEKGNIFNRETMRVRKLLVHKHEIRYLAEATLQKGLTLVPTQLYFVKGRAKVEIGVARGKKNYDKRQTIAQRDAQREMDRELKER